jgi:hypothetical protein
MSTAAIVGGSLAAAGIGAVGANQAAGAQAGAAKNAAGLQFQLGEQQLAQNQSQFNKTQQNIAPWLQAGTQGINSLAQLLSAPGQGLLTPWTQQFQAPTGAQAAATPGYQFALQQGQNSIQNSAAAQGGLLSTGSQKTLDQYSQGLADQTYQQTYSRALGEYQQAYNIFQGNQTNTFNRLASLSGMGQTAAQTLGQQSNQASQIAGQTSGIIGQQVGNSLFNAGTATASGYAGVANALSGGASNLSQYALLSNLLGQGGPNIGGANPASQYPPGTAPPPVDISGIVAPQ